MATYFHGSSEFQAAASGAATPDGMQTLFLMNPNFVPPYSDTTNNNPVTATNLFFLNPAGNALNPSTLSHAPPPNYHHHLLGLPLPTPDSDETHRPSPSPLHGVQYYNSWGGSNSTIDHQNSFGSTTVVTVDNSAGPHDVSSASQLGLSRPLPVSPRQGLSLSLSSSQQQVPYRSSNIETDRIQVKPPQVPTISPTTAAGDDMRVSGNSPSSVSVVSNGAPQSVVLGSKYLRAAQELLDEVVNVGNVIKQPDGTKEKIIIKAKNKEPVGSSSDGDENGTDQQRGPDLTTPQRQDLQMKKAKLVTMLDEVEQRYRQYRHQMQVVVSSLEQAAGIGAARTYAGLASSTISKQFRCLRDAISGQIKATSKSLGEDDCLGGVGSRLRYVDFQLRQQRALQHLGMIQHGNSSSNAWRPQRGLPERAVSVLRAWLFEHFLHPYPKDSDKQILAKQTGLTRSQVSNWFINARVRLWKPMVEEMYLEEVKGQEKINGAGEEINNANKGEQKESRSSSNNTLTSPTHQFSNSTISTSPMEASLIQQTQFGLLSELDNGVARRSPKRPRNVNEYQWQQQTKQDETRETNMMMKLGDEEDQRLFIKDGFSYLAAAGTGYAGTFNEEEQQVAPPPRFHGNSTVSLTLGLPHCDKLSLTGNPQNFLANHNINSAWL